MMAAVHNLLWPALLHFSALSIFGVTATPWTISVDTKEAIFETSPNFVGFTIDASTFEPGLRHNWDSFDTSSPKLHSLMRGLSPTVLRFGGTDADAVFFDVSEAVLNATNLLPKAVVMRKEDFDKLVQLTLVTGNHLLFDLNLERRFGSQWNPTDAIRIFEYCRSKGYGANLDWEVGNEPEFFTRQGESSLSGKTIGNDIKRLRNLLGMYPTLKSGRIVGPDVVEVGGLFHDFVNTAGDVIDAVTVHHYYFKGTDAPWEEYINPKHFSHLENLLHSARTVILNSTFPHLKLWIGETSDAYGGGTPGVSDRFVSGFLWLDKLGTSAKMGVSVVIRQSFWAQNYPLISLNLDPNPDYWLTLVHKRLVGPKVLKASIPGYTQNPPYLRIYAHCTAKEAGYPPGAVTVFGLNVNNQSEEINFSQQFVQSFDAYLMTADGPLSKDVFLNKEQLKLLPDGSLPNFKPSTHVNTQSFTFPPFTYAFLVIAKANASICV